MRMHRQKGCILAGREEAKNLNNVVKTSCSGTLSFKLSLGRGAFCFVISLISLAKESTQPLSR